VALDCDKHRIQVLEKQLADSKRDVALLKKATAFFIRDNPACTVIKRMRKAELNVSITHICQLFNVPVLSSYYQPVDNQDDVAYREQLKTIHHQNLGLMVEGE
jgi:hypothetical protein